MHSIKGAVVLLLWLVSSSVTKGFFLQQIVDFFFPAEEIAGTIVEESCTDIEDVTDQDQDAQGDLDSILDGKEIDQETPTSFTVKFKNQADRDLELYWVSANKEMVFQGFIPESSSISVDTYSKHRFCFTNAGSKEPLENGCFIMKSETPVVKYDLTMKGTKKTPSKWADFVRAKLAKEQESH